MPFFRTFVDDLLPLVPTVLRRFQRNIINLAHRVSFEAMDAVAEALEEYTDSWDIDNASAWVLDEHWGPYHNLKRNGLTDAEFRTVIHAKRLLNKSWGAADQALEIFALLIPAATLTWSYFPPKEWVVNITGVPMSDTVAALAFMRKGPSPDGGGFSVAGDNGVAVVVDAAAFNYSSIHGAVTVTGFFGSVYGVGGGAQTGYAHAAGI